MGVDSEGKVNFPGLSVEAATWIAQSGKIVGVGVDTASVDPGASTDYMAHRTLSKSQIFGMENVKMVEELPAKGFTIVALPMKLKEGTGGPLRVLAVPHNFL
jgi:kynurenine formamidase